MKTQLPRKINHAEEGEIRFIFLRAVFENPALFTGSGEVPFAPAEKRGSFIESVLNCSRFCDIMIN